MAYLLKLLIYKLETIDGQRGTAKSLIGKQIKIIKRDRELRYK